VSPSGGPDRPIFTGPFPVVRPDGTLVIPYSVFASTSGEDRIAAVSSHDGGLTFTAPVRVAGVNFAEDADLRAEVMPAAADDSAGRLYAVWSDSSMRDDGVSNDVAFSTSGDGAAWSQPVRVPLKRSVGGIALSYFLPAIAIAPGGAGAKAKLAVAVYSVRLQNGCATFMPSCKKQVDAWLVRSNDGGRTWAAPKLLRTQPMLLDWLATSTRGRMLGDYVTVSWSGGKPWAILPFATQSPLGYSQSMFAATAS
jgi:hypothetical protein